MGGGRPLTLAPFLPLSYGDAGSQKHTGSLPCGGTERSPACVPAVLSVTTGDALAR